MPVAVVCDDDDPESPPPQVAKTTATKKRKKADTSIADLVASARQKICKIIYSRSSIVVLRIEN